MIAGDQPRGAGARAVALDRGDRRVLDAGCWREIEIVVAGERQQPPPVALDPDAVLAHGLGQRAAQMAAREVVELLLREGVERVHQ